MSIPFNDTETRKGLVQFYEKETERDFGEVSGNVNRLKDFTADANLALDDLFTIGFQESGTWQLDDSGHEEFPIIRADIVSGQQNYTFLKDEQGNFMLDFYKVIVVGPDGEKKVLTPRDVQSQVNVNRFINSVPGVPTEYDKTGNGVFFDNIPNYDLTNGIEIYINREPLYFEYTDGSDVYAGIPGNMHAYLFIHPAEAYAGRKGLKNYNTLARKKAELEQKIAASFAERPRDERPRLKPLQQDNH
jgi:hypothetical protein